MHLDVIDLKTFYYRTKLGRKTKQLLQEAVLRIWDNLSEQEVVVFGFSPPLIAPFIRSAKNIFCLMPSQQGVISWPQGSNNRTMLVEEFCWPLASSSVDRVVVSHGLETCDKPDKLLQEIWRVLGPSGRVIFVVPNRVGLWARSDLTPFGYGRPYNLRQLEQQLRNNRFLTESHSGALYSPPSERGYWLRTMRFWEGLGRRIDARVMAGAIILEAKKQIYATPKSGIRDAVSVPLDVIEGFTKPKPKPVSKV